MIVGTSNRRPIPGIDCLRIHRAANWKAIDRSLRVFKAGQCKTETMLLDA